MPRAKGVAREVSNAHLEVEGELIAGTDVEGQHSGGKLDGRPEGSLGGSRIHGCRAGKPQGRGSVRQVRLRLLSCSETFSRNAMRVTVRNAVG